MSQLYDFEINSLQGKPMNLADYAGKVVLVVNTASKCGLTPQYEGLQALYEQYRDRGLVIIGAPCNQFANQEPGDAGTIQGECLINYGVSFPITEKIEVNGKGTHPLFAYLKKAAPGTLTNAVKWNFTKFLVGKDGQPIKRYAPTTKPEQLAADIEAALSA
ncbi:MULTISPECIES: glutathione peroxidase [Spongiibacter]|uniref:glutathione peroxidase n=1 Tax=Spongiibacter TaxID=630749 RepID=UPI000C3E95A0|nr:MULTISPECIES: glutathione peroxidase [Spongiibacter]MAY39662.1 glutathione peroxidase [Spongiibacter sp.]MBO6753436.1 glutathione peroxidase [Spongiibacter sp.]|tara:strand:- start:12617 stop:13099 length:483 start_codon:yes stop_codon:yes gene_type:complete